MGAMAASIAHEISQPLGAIVANGSAGLRWLAHAVPDLDETRAALTRIVADGHRAGNVIKSVRTMVKAERGERAALATNDLIEEILGLVRSELWAQQILVRTELGTNLPDVVADRVQLQQVLLNLIVNAAEAMATITDRPRTLDIRSDLHDDEKILVTVADSGSGIDPQHGERIFDAFFSTKPSGMGMGLSICRSIVESHGGRLWVSPGSFHGTIFHVLIPINADQA
jgi:signal transduction histidine kinase